MELMKNLICALLYLMALNVAAQDISNRNVGIEKIGDVWYITDTTFTTDTRYNVKYQIVDSLTLLNILYTQTRREYQKASEKRIEALLNDRAGDIFRAALDDIAGDGYYITRAKERYVQDSTIMPGIYNYRGYETKVVNVNRNLIGRDTNDNSLFLQIVPISPTSIRANFQSYDPIELYWYEGKWVNKLDGVIHVLRE